MRKKRINVENTGRAEIKLITRLAEENFESSFLLFLVVVWVNLKENRRESKIHFGCVLIERER